MRPRTHITILSLGVVLATLHCWAPSARAGEEELVVSPAPAYSVVRASGATAHGGELRLDVDYGLSDSWAIRGTASYAAHYLPGEAGDPLSVGGLGLGVLYTFDVLKVIPFASLTAGAVALGGADQGLRFDAVLSIGVGLDYLVSRSFSVGFEVRYHLLIPDLLRYPLWLGVSLRLSWRRQ